MYKLQLRVDGVKVIAEDNGEYLYPIPDAVNALGEPVSAFLLHKSFPTYSLEVPGTRMSLEAFNKKWTEKYNSKPWTITFDDGTIFLQQIVFFHEKSMMDYFLDMVDGMLAETFGKDLDELYLSSVLE